MSDTYELGDLELSVRDLIGANYPPKAAPTFTRVCPETGETFVTTGRDRMFSTDQAKADFHNRSSKIGRQLVPLAMAWRQGRNAKGDTPQARALRASANGAFLEMCRLLDAHNADDRKAGRMKKLAYIRKRAAMAGQLSPQETAAWQRKYLEALAAVKARLGPAAEAMSGRDLADLAMAELRRQVKAAKAAILADMAARQAAQVAA